jgi:hypothetical protein
MMNAASEELFKSSVVVSEKTRSVFNPKKDSFIRLEVGTTPKGEGLAKVSCGESTLYIGEEQQAIMIYNQEFAMVEAASLFERLMSKK